MSQPVLSHWTCGGPCGKRFVNSAPNVIRAGWRWCPDCTYKDEVRPDPPLIIKHSAPSVPQQETLF